MTRINIIPPSELMDQHLVAEYREIFMVGSALVRSRASPNWEKNKQKWPSTFTLNTGHVKFFFDKGQYLYKRYLSLVAEMKRRGMAPNPERVFKREQWPDELFNDWLPTPDDQAIVRERIAQRISQRPGWYRKTEPKDDST